MTISLSDSLRKAIADCGYSNYALSHLTGISQSVLNRFVSGERDITLGTASKIAVVIGAELKTKAARK
jgi:plasmid maintenance system antidote protein VapI